MRILIFSMVIVLFLNGFSAAALCPQGDLNGDCRVSWEDLIAFAGQWLDAGECEGESACANFDGINGVDFGDFAVLASHWLEGIPLVINEFMASNSSASGIKDPQNQYDDWIEIYNFGDTPIDLAGMYLTDDLDTPAKWQVPSGYSAQTTVPAGGFVVFWADEDMQDGPLHANFKLSAGGEEIGLFDTDGSTPIDTLTFGAQTTNISYGRYPDASDNWRFFPTPTAGAINNGAYAGEIEDVEFSHTRGFYNTSFTLTLACTTPGVSIYYTTDGKDPISGESPAVGLDPYTAPVAVSSTKCVRAAAIKTGWMPSNIDTQTYIFVAEVITQSPNGELPGPGWPANYAVNNHRMDYGMDPDVVNSTDYSGLVDDALLAIPTMSLVTDLKNLFDPMYGVYAKSGIDTSGAVMECPCSLELIYPDGTAGFQVDCGMRIRGGASQNSGNPKHAFRFLFRTQYGNSKLNYPLFGDEGVDQFDKVDLRTAANYAWSYFNDVNNYHNTFVRDEYSRLVQGMMGYPYTRGRYYHLYMNGQYWGLFQTEERADARHAASYMGGSKDDYDVAKADVVGWDRPVVANDGNLDAYRRLYDAIKDGVGTIVEYFSLQGMNTDGARNPAYERLLDVDNLMDYMLIEYYTCDYDGPGSRFVIINNFTGIYNRVNPDGWKWFQHDSEHSFGVYEKDDTNRENMVTPFSTAGASFTYFNPHWLHEQLANNNAEYRMYFADRTQERFFNGGMLSADKVWQTMTGLSTQIDSAIIAESARWGDANANPARTRATWLEALQYLHNYIYGTSSVLSDYTANNHQDWPMKLREIRVLDQFRSVGWFPSIDAPQYSQHGGNVATGYSLTITNPNASGTIYYTTTGNDPRQAPLDSDSGPDIVLAAENAAKQVLVPTGTIRVPDGTVRAETWTGIEGVAVSNLTSAPGYPNSPNKTEFWNSFQMPVINWADTYGTRVRALVYPPTTGSYTFWIASDDNSQLRMSTDATSANAVQIASVPDWTDENQWTKFTEQKSATRTLQAGSAYYIEALQKEHGGGDNLSVAWSGPGISGPVVIAGQYLSIPDTIWAGPGYSATGWINGSGAVGYENNPGDPVNYSSYINSGINVKTPMSGINTSCYIRIPFQYSGQAITQLILRMRYDDGFVAFINGREVVRDRVNTTNPLDWNTNASSNRPDNEAITPTDFDISAMIPYLRTGTNILAIQGLNDALTSSDFLITASLTGKMKSPGTPSADATVYAAPVALTKSTEVKARVFTGTEWSALNDAIFAVGPVKDSLRVTELMYHPSDPNTEYVELKNISASAINLNLVKFTKGISYTFGNTTLEAGQHILVVENVAEFEDKYGTGLNVAGQYTGSLDNGGERIKLEDAIGNAILDFEYKDGWRSITDGDGYSLTIINPANPDTNSWRYKDSWRASAYVNGSPDADDSGIIPNPGAIVINEVLAHAHAEAPDWIELYNMTAGPIDISGWYLSDNEGNPLKYRFAQNTIIPGHGYLVVTETANFGSSATDAGRLIAFALSENGEKVCLTSALDTNGILTGYRENEDFGASETGVSFGRYYKSSTNTYNFVPMDHITSGAANAYPKVGPIVITEIMYHPDWPAGGSYVNEEYEYIELYNNSASPVTLYDSEVSVPWKFTGGIDYTFAGLPNAVTIPAGGKILVVKNPTAFHWRYPDVSVGIYGPYSGKLANEGEQLELSKPGDIDEFGVRQYIRVERINYSDGSHPGSDPVEPDLWPTAADGNGKSLGRINPTLYGNDPNNWQAITPTPGT